MTRHDDALPIPDDLITTTEAARLLKVHTTSVWRWILKGQLRAYRRGSRAVISKADLAEFLQPVSTRRERTAEARRTGPPTGRERRAMSKKTEEILRRHGMIRDDPPPPAA